MEIKRISKDKDQFMNLLLLGDEQENMIKKYLYRGELFALFDDDLKTVCVVTKEKDESFEIKNLATYEKYHGFGYGTKMLQFVIEELKPKCKRILLGTGENEKILSYYAKFGFEYSHTLPNFFVDNYDHIMMEDGKQLVDMIYLKLEFDS
jgi:GNAT superfamily N-acetyltransferase